MIGIDPEKDLIGLAIQSHYFAVGSMALWAEPGVGAVIIQSIPKMAYDYGVAGLNLMRAGHSAATALQQLIAHDTRSDYRQVAMVDTDAPPEVFTGESCVAEAGDVRGETFCCQANMMANPGVPEAMAKAFSSHTGEFPERLVAALKAAESKGGDLRGKQSAALIVVRRHPEGHHLADRPFDLRVDDHPEPLSELERLVELKSAYHHSTRGDAALVREDFEEALREYQRSEEKSPGQTELYFWRALALLNTGRESDAIPLMKTLLKRDRKWFTLFERVAEAGLLEKDPELLERLSKIAEE